MSRKINYRKQLLQAIELLLENTPSARVRAQRIVQRCYIILVSEEKQLTLDAILWGSSFVALTDSFLSENEKYLRDIRENLLGHHFGNMKRTIFSDDYHPYFTVEEAKWYAQLVSLVNFLLAIPFSQFHLATEDARRNNATWEMMSATIPEVAQAVKMEEEYRQRKTLIEEIIVENPLPENIGDETIYHLMLREVTSVLIDIQVGKPAVYLGYPILDGAYTEYGDVPTANPFSMIESLQWAKKVLDTLVGNDSLFVSWSLSNPIDAHSDALLISLH